MAEVDLIVARTKSNSAAWPNPAPWQTSTWTGVVSSQGAPAERHACVAATDFMATVIAPTGPADDAFSVDVALMLRATPELVAALQIISQQGDEHSRSIANAALGLAGRLAVADISSPECVDATAAARDAA